MSKIIKTPSNSPIMGRIDTLVNELCPEGVEMVTLGSLGKFENIGVDKKSIENEEDVVLLNYTDVYHHKYINSSIPSMIVTASDKKRLACNVLKGDIFVTPTSETVDDIGHSSVITEDINNCVYSYHIMRYRLDTHNMVTSFYINYMFDLNIVKQQILKKAQGLTRFGLSKDKFASIEIPLPPLSIQQEIVSVLDSFTTLIDKMKQEVEKRKKQMEYYREKLLTFEDGECEWKTLGEICNVITGGEPPKNSIKGNEPIDTMVYPIWANGREIYGYADTFSVEKDSVCISSIGANTGAVFFHKGRFTPIIRLKVLIPLDENIDVRYLYYAVSKIDFKTKKSSVPNMNSSEVKRKIIQIPPTYRQKQIASTLDKFESYITKLEKMIVLRQKQYEYYREQLLTFE